MTNDELADELIALRTDYVAMQARAIAAETIALVALVEAANASADPLAYIGSVRLHALDQHGTNLSQRIKGNMEEMMARVEVSIMP